MPHFDKTFNTLWEWATDDGRRTPAEAYAYLGRKAEAKRDFEHACTPYGRSLIQDLNLSQQDALRMLFTDVREELRIAADLPDPEDEQSQISWARRIGRFLKTSNYDTTL